MLTDSKSRDLDTAQWGDFSLCRNGGLSWKDSETAGAESGGHSFTHLGELGRPGAWAQLRVLTRALVSACGSGFCCMGLGSEGELPQGEGFKGTRQKRRDLL